MASPHNFPCAKCEKKFQSQKDLNKHHCQNQKQPPPPSIDKKTEEKKSASKTSLEQCKIEFDSKLSKKSKKDNVNLMEENRQITSRDTLIDQHRNEEKKKIKKKIISKQKTRKVLAKKGNSYKPTTCPITDIALDSSNVMLPEDKLICSVSKPEMPTMETLTKMTADNNVDEMIDVDLYIIRQIKSPLEKPVEKMETSTEKYDAENKTKVVKKMKKSRFLKEKLKLKYETFTLQENKDRVKKIKYLKNDVIESDRKKSFYNANKERNETVNGNETTVNENGPYQEVFNGDKNQVNELSMGDGQNYNKEDTSMYSCNQCDKTYKNIDHLKRHEMIHLGIKFFCSKCTSAYTRKDKLNAHMRKKHSESSLGYVSEDVPAPAVEETVVDRVMTENVDKFAKNNKK